MDGVGVGGGCEGEGENPGEVVWKGAGGRGGGEENRAGSGGVGCWGAHDRAVLEEEGFDLVQKVGVSGLLGRS